MEPTPELLAAVVANARDVVGVIGPDGRFTYLSPAIEQVLGWPAEQLVGMPAGDGVHRDDRGVIERRLAECGPTDGIVEPVEYRVPATDGTWRWLEAVVTDLRDDPAVRGIVLNARDVTDRKQAEALLASQSAVLELIARGEPVASTLERIVAMLEDQVADANVAIVVQDAPELPPRFVVAPNVEPELRPDLATRPGWSQPITDVETSAVLGSVMLGLEERRFPRTDEQRVAELAANLAAIAIARARSAEQLAFQARHDPLTGLVNREVFLERLDRALVSARRTGDTIAVLFLDLDRFKDVNDTLGHEIGDRILVALAGRLQASVRGNDTVARLGGDEFVLVCHVEGRRHAQLVADRVLERVNRPYTVGDREIDLTASIGIALASEVPDTNVPRPDPAGASWSDDLLRDADVAMYRAKERGRARVEVYDDTLRTRLLTRTETEQALRRALDRDEFELVYQPVFALDDGALAGVEALLRWRRPGHGLVFPGEFMAAADALGLIVPIGEQVLREAGAQFAEWRVRFPETDRLTLSVNVSPSQLVHPSFVGSVRSMLADTGLPADVLCLEITDHAMRADLVGTLLALDSLRDLGVLIWLDDFGSGNSSLEYLRQLPIDGLKLDRTFISGIAESSTDEAIVGAVVTMAHALGMCVVGEGVERSEQRDRLADLACDYAQGFLLARPLPAGAFVDQVLGTSGRATA